MTDELLPALPEPVEDVLICTTRNARPVEVKELPADDYYTADQLRAYAREAIRLAQGDAARIDWLEANGCQQFLGPHAYAPSERRWFDSDTTGSDYGPTLRALIDAAIAPTPNPHEADRNG